MIQALKIVQELIELKNAPGTHDQKSHGHGRGSYTLSPDQSPTAQRWALDQRKSLADFKAKVGKDIKLELAISSGSLSNNEATVYIMSEGLSDSDIADIQTKAREFYGDAYSRDPLGLWRKGKSREAFIIKGYVDNPNMLRIKHLPGEHNQLTHAGSRATVGEGDRFEHEGVEYTIEHVTPTHVTFGAGGPLGKRYPIDMFRQEFGLEVAVPSKEQYNERVAREQLISRISGKYYVQHGIRTNAKLHLDGLIAQGYTKIVSRKVGAVTRTYAENGEGLSVPLSGDDLEYVKMMAKGK